VKLLYIHGWNSGVGGVKPTYLRTHGHEIIEPALDHDDFEAALKTAEPGWGGRDEPEVWLGPARPALPGMEEVGAGPDCEARDHDPPFPGR